MAGLTLQFLAIYKNEKIFFLQNLVTLFTWVNSGSQVPGSNEDEVAIF